MLADVLKEARVIVSVGSGGVGKTTISAAMGLAAALQGQKVLVMTIDPARRLANALGFAELDDDECELDPALWRPKGYPPEGQLFAMMLDQKLTFDRLIDRFAPSVESATSIKKNRWYQQMSTSLAGAQDYMAVARLYEMTQQRDYDLIILDTPPTSNALDFLNAPERIGGILQMRSMQWIQDKLASEGSKAGKFLRWSGGTLLKLLGRVTGQEVMQEIWRLLDDLSVLYDSFQVHADATSVLLRSPKSKFLQISVAQRLPLMEALFLQLKLIESGMNVEGFVLNRVPGFLQHADHWNVLPEQTHEFSEEVFQEIAERVSPDVSKQPDTIRLLRQMTTHLKHFQQKTELAREAVVFLKEQVVGHPWIQLVPLISYDISDLEGLQLIATLLLDGSFSPSYPPQQEV